VTSLTLPAADARSGPRSAARSGSRSDASPDPRSDVRRAALRDVVPMAAAVAPLGVAVGVAIRGVGVPLLLGNLSTPLLFSGAAQLTLLTMVAGGASLLATLFGLLLANARLAVYSAGVAAHFRPQPTWFRWLAPTLLVDQTFLLVTSRRDLDRPERFRRYWLTAGGALGTVWVAAVVVGSTLGPLLPAAVPIELAAPVLFLGLLAPTLDGRGPRATALVAGAVALIGYAPLGPAALPVAIAVGTAVTVRSRS
jgi:predicted branched-subunit amino acid permease